MLVNICYICRETQESVSHLFHHCRFTKHVYILMSYQYKINTDILGANAEFDFIQAVGNKKNEAKR
jgi:hypothetical protein